LGNRAARILGLVMVLIRVNGKRALNTPAVLVQAAPECSDTYTSFFSPINKKLRLTVERYRLAVAAVARLLNVGSPSYISGFIVAVVIDAVKAVLRRWRFSDIGKEVFKRVAPALTDAYATPTIIAIFRLIGVSTATDDTRPGLVFLRNLSNTAISVLGTIYASGLSGSFTLETATTLGMTRTQAAPRDNGGVSAFALAQPILVTGLNADGRIGWF